MLVDIENKFYDDDLNSFNIIGEIPGSDKAKADEIVMLGGHFDSWQSGTGATDNGAGSAVMLEAMRILKATGVKMRRTVRIGLWTGEEQGLLGSRAYMKQHFGDPNVEDPATHLIKILPEHSKLDAYYNIDNGTGKIRGVYLQGNEMVAPIFNAWMVPFHDLGMTTLTIRNTGGTDHLAYDSRRPPRFSIHPRPHGLRHPHPPLQHGRLRTHPGGGHETNGRYRRELRLPNRQPRRNVATQTAAKGATRPPVPMSSGKSAARWRALISVGAALGRPSTFMLAAFSISA